MPEKQPCQDGAKRKFDFLLIRPELGIENALRSSLFRPIVAVIRLVMSETPIGIALVVCDQILEEAGTGKKSLIGLFNSITCDAFPAVLYRVCVFVSMTNLNGHYKTVLKCTNETHNLPLMSLDGVAESQDPNAVLSLGFEFGKFAFPKPGLHIFEFICDDALILQSRFNVFSKRNLTA